MKTTRFINKESLALATLTLLFSVSAQYALSAWGEPTSVGGQGTLGAPVHVGAFQTKSGPLIINTSGSSSSLGLEIPKGYGWVGATPVSNPLGFGVEGRSGAEKYCTPDGSSCVTTARLLADLAAGGGPLPLGSVFMFEGVCPVGWVSLSSVGEPYYLRIPLGYGGSFTTVGAQGGNGGYHNHISPGLGNGVRFDFGGGYPIQIRGNASMAYAYAYPAQINLRFCAAP